jgi:hypothetical protein
LFPLRTTLIVTVSASDELPAASVATTATVWRLPPPRPDFSLTLNGDEQLRKSPPSTLQTRIPSLDRVNGWAIVPDLGGALQRTISTL